MTLVLDEAHQRRVLRALASVAESHGRVMQGLSQDLLLRGMPDDLVREAEDLARRTRALAAALAA